MSVTIVITCEAVTADGTGTCPAAEYITAAEIRELRNHPDASPRWDDIDAARHIAMSMGWRTSLALGPLKDLCPRHCGHKPTRKRLTP